MAHVSALAMALALTVLPYPAAAELRGLPVPAATIHANDTITMSMVTDRQFRVTPTSLAGYATSRGQMIGMQARRRLIAGRPVPLAALKIPTAVKRGASVSATYTDEGVSIATFLIALQDGAAGDVITARNPATGAVIRASVNADGSLNVGEP